MMGPRGTGKSTIGRALSETLNVPFIEGGEMESRMAIEKMQSDVSLANDDHTSWLDRINQRATDMLLKSASDSVVVSCAALKEVYRDQIRQHLSAHKIKVVFIDLQADKEALVKRLQERQGHYLSPDLVDSQLASYEKPSSKEYDVVPVDAVIDEKAVLDTVQWALNAAVTWL